MSDSNSINPVGLSTAVVGGAAAAAIAPKAYAAVKKYSPAVKAGADKVIITTKNAATNVGSKVGDYATVAGSKIKDASKTVFQTVVGYAERGFNAAKKLVPTKIADFAGKATTNIAKFVKKPMVATALIAGLAYGVVSKLSDKG